jgi:CubicO group peptidase (beta-lactamase class C family)
MTGLVARSRARVVVTALALLGGVTSAGGQTPDTHAIAERLDAEIPPLLEVGEVTGLSAALVRAGELVWSGAFGVLDTDTGEPVTALTIFQAASLTKQFFAYTALRLADQGVYDLDTPLADYLPYERLEDEDRYPQITGRMALSHSTGLPNWGGDRLELGFDPGTDWQYSGEGYVYLQKTLEHLTGEDLAALVQREVLEPLGLENSWMAWREDFEGRAASRHDAWGVSNGVQKNEQRNAAWSLLTTGEDYARFLIALMEGCGLEPGTLSEALDRQIQVNSPRTETEDRLYWGLGWGLQYGSAGRGIWQWGHNNGFRAYLLAYPDRRDAFVYFTNSDNGLSIARDLLALVEEAAGLSPDDHFALDHLNYEQHDAPDRVARRGLVGVFRDDGVDAGLARFEELRTEQPDLLDQAFTGRVASALEGLDEAEAAIALLNRSTELHPRSANARNELGNLLLNLGRYRQAAERFEAALELSAEHRGATRARAWLGPVLAALDHPPAVPRALLERYLGDYGPRHITLEAGGLFYQRDGNPRYRLRPMSEDTFFLEGLGSFRIRFASDAAGHVTKIVGLYLDGTLDETPRDP